jgi:ParB family chromosome partitioning protein
MKEEGADAMADDSRSRLGRGLAALMGDVVVEPRAVDAPRQPRRIPIEYVKANPRNPRRNFADAELEELAASIKERGIIQPIVVRAIGEAKDRYEIIAGERRWRAAQRAGLHEIPIVALEATDSQALELAIIENVQRTDLNALEEAGGYQRLAGEYGHSHEGIAQMVGKSRSHVSNTLRLLKLPEQVKAYISAGEISAGAARMLVGVADPERMAREIVERGLNVRQVEALAKERAHSSGKAGKRNVRGKSPDTIALEQRLSDALGLTVTLAERGSGGVLQIHYRAPDQLEDVLRRLEQN